MLKIWSKTAFVSFIFLLVFSHLSPAHADSYAKVEFQPLASTPVAVDSFIPLVFKFTGGIAAKSTDCGDITGLEIGIGLKDSKGNYANATAQLENSVRGLNSAVGWTTKVLSGGLQCTYTLRGIAEGGASPVNGSATWIFSDEASAGLPFLSNRFDASNLFVTWRSPITGAGWGRGGQAQTVANESGRWSGEVGGTLAPFITFSGVNRGDTINLPTKILVSAITKDSLPIAEFNFGQNGGEYLLWRANPTDSGWTRNGNSICGPISTVKKSDGTSVQSATCQFVPLSDAQNVQLWAVGYVEDHRVFKSESVYANIQTLRPFISSGIHFSPKKDASGEFVSAEISGTIQKLPSGTVVRICLEGKNPTNSGQNTLECQSGTVDVSSGYKLNFAVPHVWNLHYYVESLESPYKIGNGGTTDAYGDWENAKYECQNQGGCLSKVQTASANKSRYSEGYAAIKEATLSSLRTLQFFGYFSPNHKLTKQNAVNWCNQVVSMLPFHGGWGPNAISTWAQGCTTAALKIPYSK